MDRSPYSRIERPRYLDPETVCSVVNHTQSVPVGYRLNGVHVTGRAVNVNARIAFVSGPIRRSMRFGSKLKVASSISQKTGRMPFQYNT